MFKGFTCLVILGLWCAADSVAANALPDASITRVIDRAHALLGTPYNGSGTSVGQGFDCSGLLVYLFKTQANVRLPRTTTQMHRSSAATVQRAALKPGDAVFFKGNGSGQVSHVGLYVGKGKFIHSPSTGKRVRIDSLSSRYWKKHYTTAKRFHAAG
ncbi:C40 family peptidase [Pseudomonas sp. RGB]|uniref:C40 family peptidase n=1 Tax=Pseudomonas sp. RGB TaxID=2598474 RepID=UPI0011907BB7|nr:C40 family peptidase [Pseudomonas sp. RGB]TVT91936.1 NlpC/P60 family protein [Pseudomonas sp. RGB]